MKHEPVLLQEVVQYLRPNRDNGVLVDATVGLGGHAAALLEAHPHVTLIAIDCFSGWRRHAAARQRNAIEVVTGLARCALLARCPSAARSPAYREC